VPQPVSGGTETGSSGQLHGGHGPLAGQAQAHDDGGRTCALHAVLPLLSVVQHVGPTYPPGLVPVPEPMNVPLPEPVYPEPLPEPTAVPVAEPV
jgi:hypothetical protein